MQHCIPSYPKLPELAQKEKPLVGFAYNEVGVDLLLQGLTNGGAKKFKDGHHLHCLVTIDQWGVN